MKLNYTRFCVLDKHFSFSSKFHFLSLFALILEKQKQKRKENLLNTLCNTTYITHEPLWRSTAFVMQFLDGVSTHTACARHYFQTCFSRNNCSLSVISFLNICVLVPNNAITLRGCSFKSEFSVLQRDMHNSKFVFPTKWDLFLENNSYTEMGTIHLIEKTWTYV